MRGATSFRLDVCPVVHVSIHAPRVGRDGFNRCFLYHGNVSIHAPHAGRDADPFLYDALESNVSIHAPHAGRDIGPAFPEWSRKVSIHAPHAGRD